MSESILTVFRDDSYTLGRCSVRVYDRRRRDVFGDNFLYKLWCDCLNSSNPPGTNDVLRRTFCGMEDISADAVTGFLHTRNPLLLLCIDSPNPGDPFNVAGFVYPSVFCGTPQTERSILAGYCFFRPYWGTPESTVLGMLGISYLFTELNLQAIHGQYYATNVPTARYMARFGSREVGRIPKFILDGDGKLVDCVVSTLMRADFESYVTRELLTLAGETVTNGRQERRSG